MAKVTPIETEKAKCAGCGRIRGHKVNCPKLHDDAEPVTAPAGVGVAAAAHDDIDDDKDDVGDDDDDDDDDDDESDFGDERTETSTDDDDDRVFPPIAIIPGALDALQESYNLGDFSGDKQRQDDCEFEELVDGRPMQCPNVAVIKKTIKNHCDKCDRDKKVTLKKLCLPHAVNVFGGGQPSTLQTEMDLAV